MNVTDLQRTIDALPDVAGPFTTFEDGKATVSCTVEKDKYVAFVTWLNACSKNMDALVAIVKSAKEFHTIDAERRAAIEYVNSSLNAEQFNEACRKVNATYEKWKVADANLQLLLGSVTL